MFSMGGMDDYGEYRGRGCDLISGDYVRVLMLRDTGVNTVCRRLTVDRSAQARWSLPALKKV